MLNIKVEDFEGVAISELIDINKTIARIIQRCYNSKTIRIIKYIDLYDDTIFNSIMVKDCILDIEDLITSLDLSREDIDVLLKLKSLCKETLKHPHLYLKFYGD
ncbi:MAG: hypothetical protein ACK5KN_11500 [Dysgonomonas sp.]|uniref:hypothetical protein n=1 Tax=Dysgonomonas sp. TaxID=1891233 RepID=UPI003A893279